jgi:hypothetical protein
MDASGEDSRSMIQDGSTGPLDLKGKTLKALPWRVREDEFAPKDQEYGVSASPTSALLAQALAPRLPRRGPPRTSR